MKMIRNVIFTPLNIFSHDPDDPFNAIKKVLNDTWPQRYVTMIEIRMNVLRVRYPIYGELSEKSRTDL